MIAAMAKKDLKLNFPVGLWAICLLSALMLVPNYPSIVSVGYVLMAVGIMTSVAKENRDLAFSMTLPIKRDDAVKGRIAALVFYEGVHLILCAVFALLSVFLVSKSANIVGLDANFAFFGVALLCLGAFNAIFFPTFYKTAYKAAVPMVLGVVGFVLAYLICELTIQLIMPLRVVLDSLNASYIGWRLLVFFVGAAGFVALTALSVKLSVKNFSEVNVV